MRIGILGTRGIPNNYGGFEQWAEHLSQGLVSRGCEVFVYNSHNHPYKGKEWNGVSILHKYDPEYKIGNSGQFIYDLNCILDSRKRNFDIILQLGYTSSSIWGWLLPRKNSFIITNMDGMEWTRDKFSNKVKHFLKKAEKLGVYYSDLLIADSPVIKEYYDKHYNKPTHYIPYGITIFTKEDVQKLTPYNIEPNNYHLLIARLEPENNIETIIQGVIKSKSSQPLLIIGDHNIPHGKYLYEKYHLENKIRFLGVIYEKGILDNLRFFSNFYFHGHSVGGTNPSLLEAMASSAVICAHNNPYNTSVLENNGFFFNTANDISKIIDKENALHNREEHINKNINRIKNAFLLDYVIDLYYKLFLQTKPNKLL